MKVPAVTDPLAKLIRTGEGIVLYAFNIGVAVLAAVSDVSPTTAVKYATIFNGVAFAFRQLLKIAALISPLVGGGPVPFDPGASITVVAPPVDPQLGPDPTNFAPDGADTASQSGGDSQQPPPGRTSAPVVPPGEASPIEVTDNRDQEADAPIQFDLVLEVSDQEEFASPPAYEEDF